MPYEITNYIQTFDVAIPFGISPLTFNVHKKW